MGNLLTENLLKIAVSANVMPFSLIAICECFGSTFCLHLQGLESESCSVESHCIAFFLSDCKLLV